MRTVIAKMSSVAEFWTVVVLAFGFFICSSTLGFFKGHSRALSNGWALSLVAFELAILVVVAWIGHVRGWSLRKLGLQPSWRLTGAGVLLWVATNVILGATYAVVSATMGRIPDPAITAGTLSFWAVVLVSLVNPVFEETLVVGYVVEKTSAHGAVFAITASALLRFLYHTYQGPIAAVYILPLGLIFAAVYVHYRALWALIVAHAIMNLIGLGRLLHPS
ncbi:MAG TPA: type II CAAX endopeptidase family protein [Thermoanaerobaculia bacterium]|nr:type II CAAX endopeptidase family protein [Thermoanaerobaculia bacterium]